jgi:hypothetical protein
VIVPLLASEPTVSGPTESAAHVSCACTVRLGTERLPDTDNACALKAPLVDNEAAFAAPPLTTTPAAVRAPVTETLAAEAS